MRELEGEAEEYTLTAEEKAEQLHISVSRLYKVKDRYPHQTKGGRRIYFKR